MTKTILITGAAGMIGSNLVHHLLKTTDYNIVGLDDMSGGYHENLPLENRRLNFHVGGVEDYKLTRAIFRNYRPNIVYHAAAYAAEGLSPFIRTFNYTNNLVGTANIVNQCIDYDVERLVFFSSIAVYGNLTPPFKETDIPCPIDPYGVAKYAAEMDIRIAGEQHGLDYAIVRPFNVYGERQNIWDKYRNVLGIWIYNYLADVPKPIKIYGDGEQQRSFTYVQDIMKPLKRLGTEPQFSKEIINIGNSISYTLNELAHIFQVVIGKRLEIEYLPARHEVKSAICAVDKYSDMGTISTPLLAGIIKMWEWARAEPMRQLKESPIYEVTKGMYEHWKIK